MIGLVKCCAVLGSLGFLLLLAGFVAWNAPAARLGAMLLALSASLAFLGAILWLAVG